LDVLEYASLRGYYVYWEEQIVDRNSDDYAAIADVAIVGAGPIGLELAVALKQAGVSYVQFDAGQIGHTLTWWPRETHFFSTSERLAISGVPIQMIGQGRLTGEAYLAYLRGIVEQFDLAIHTYERVTHLVPVDGGFVLRTSSQLGERRYRCQKVVLAKGNMDRPNRLGIPGEELPHVTHYFTDPHRYFRKRLLIVGGRNSAVEAALRCWRAGCYVALSYRRAGFESRMVKPFLLPDLKTQIRVGNVVFYPETAPLEIAPGRVILRRVSAQDSQDTRLEVLADFVLLCTGFVADLDLFESAGVELRGLERLPVYDPETMETNVPGLYLAGTAAAGNEQRYRLFIENCHIHVSHIVHALTGRRPDRIGAIDARRYEMPLADIEAN
jgi:thioredoxin reductase (NADPH)